MRHAYFAFLQLNDTEFAVQGPAWGGAVLGPSPPAEGLLQGGMPSLRDIQAQQQQVRESCSRSFGAAGSSPGSAGRDGFASYLQW